VKHECGKAGCSHWRRGHSSPITATVLSLPLNKFGAYPLPSAPDYVVSRTTQDSWSVHFKNRRPNDELECIVRTTVPKSPFSARRWGVRIVIPDAVDGALANSKSVDEVARTESLDRAFRRAMRELRLADARRRLGAPR
jgi:hypothetical protein